MKSRERRENGKDKKQRKCKRVTAEGKFFLNFSLCFFVIMLQQLFMIFFVVEPIVEVEVKKPGGNIFDDIMSRNDLQAYNRIRKIKICYLFWSLIHNL